MNHNASPYGDSPIHPPTMMKKYVPILLFAMLSVTACWAQTTIVPTSETTILHGKKYYFHIMESGQSVFAVARAYGLHYSAAILRTDLQHVNAGDTVWLPINEQSRAAVRRVQGTEETLSTQPVPSANATTSTVIVSQGSTLYSLAKEYNTTVDELYRLNEGLKERGLKAGQQLLVPAAKDTKSVSGNPNRPHNTSTSQNAPQNQKEQSRGSNNPNSQITNQQQGKYRYQSTPSTVKNTTTITRKQNNDASAMNPPAIRERISADKVFITIMLPLHLEQLDKISTTKFDVEQRGKKDYKSFEFIQFYEGLQIALEELAEHGVNVHLNVVDITDESENTIRQAYSSHNVAQSDLLIALLQRRGFEIVAQMAKQDRLFVVNPLSTRTEVLRDNPYVVKYMPGIQGKTRALAQMIQKQYPSSPVFVIHSAGKEETEVLKSWENELKSMHINYTLVDWSHSQSTLAATLKSAAGKPVVVNIYDRGKEKNRIQINLLMNRLNSVKSNTPVLVTMNNLVRDMGDVDFNQLQNCSYHFVYPTFLDYNDAAHKHFVDEFKDTYKTEPVGEFAGAGHDIALYFGSALSQRGSEYWKTLITRKPDGMLFPLHLQQSGEGSGIENQAGQVYEMIDFRLVAVK